MALRLRSAALALGIALAGAWAPSALAQPDAGKLRVASQEFEAGARAFKAKDYELAAGHFEAADAAAPSAKSLRLAIRARSEAGQASRASTLAALALDRHPGDAEIVKLARETLEKFASSLHKASVSCASPCVLAIGTRTVHGEATTRWTIYLDPGSTTVSASFFGGGGARSSVEAVAAGATEVRLEPGGGDAPPPGEEPKPKPKPKPDPVDTPPDIPTDPPAEQPDGGGSGLHPAFFIGGLVATAAAGGVLIWSGIDTRENPGPDAVRAACAGRGEDCPEYQDGLAKETRTNVLIGVTAGLGAVTLLFAILTDWGGSPEPEKTESAASPWRAPRPTVSFGDRGATFGATGRF